MSGATSNSASSLSSSGFEDGLGRRVLAFDRETGEMLERLVLRPELAAFEKVLFARIDTITTLDDERFARPRDIEENEEGRLNVVSEFVPGRRLSDALDAARDAGIVPGLDAALGLLLEMLPALGNLHGMVRFAHGSVSPARVVFTPAGQIVLLDPIYGAALERLAFTRQRLWNEFGIAVPPSAGPARLDIAADLTQAGMTAAAVIVGRPLGAADYPNGIQSLRAEILEVAQIRGTTVFANGLEKFLDRVLPLAGRKPFPSADDAALDLRQLVRREIGIDACRAALLDFLQQVESAEAERGAAEEALAAQHAIERREQARIDAARAKQEAERRERERAEAEARERARLEAERREKEKQEAERRERERIEAERRERERQAKLEAERKEKERVEAERRERERLEAARLEKERLERERREREQLEAELRERARLEAERREKERLERERIERERLEAEQRERARLEAERREKERQEAERRERERLEAERRERERLEAERRERERQAKLEAERKEKERLETERREKERLEKERQERERHARLEAERKEKERLEAERREKERLEAERRERERQVKLEAERKEKEREKERLEAERRERERLEKERLERERVEAERREKERAAAEQREREQRERELAAQADADERAESAGQSSKRRKRDKSARAKKDRLRSAAPVSGGTTAVPERAPAAASSKSSWLVPPDRAAAFEPPVPVVPQIPVQVAAPQTYPVYMPPASQSPIAAAAPPPVVAPPVVPPPVTTPMPIGFGPSKPTAQPHSTPIALAQPTPIRLKQAETSSPPPATFAPRRDRDVAFTPDFSANPTDTGGGGIPWKMAAAAGVVLLVGIAAAHTFWPTGKVESTRTKVTTSTASAATSTPAPSSTAGQLVVATQPPGARVLLDGKAVGESPVTLPTVAPGRHTLTLITESGSVKKTVRVEAGRSLSLDIPIFSGFAAISAPIVVEVSEGGRLLGTSENQVMLSPGRHQLRFTNNALNYQTTQTVDIEPGEVYKVSLDPRGSANINAQPWAEVWIDGVRVGETPIANVSIALGVREIVFRNPQFGERKLVTTITGGAPAALSVDFSKQ